MTEQTLWTIGSADGRSPDLLDTYQTPLQLGDVLWRVGDQETGQRWPLFHPSEADPEGGYRLHPYAIEFTLDTVPSGAYLLRITYLVIAPRLADLDVEVNGVTGAAYLRPSPSRSGEIRLHAGLHTAIYAEGAAEIVIPAPLLRQGTNRLTLIARDRGEVIRVDRIEAIKRLDRMANAAGFVYQQITLSHLATAPPGALASVEARPSVVYQTAPDGTLYEHCHLYLELNGPIASTHLTLELNAQRIDLDIPAAPFGHVHLPFRLIDGTGPVSYTLTGTLGNEAITRGGTFTRKRKWTVYVAPHVHTDIGYTHRQWEVAERLCRTIDAALNLLDPPTAPFAFHVDATWSLETYLQTRNEEQKRRLFAQIAAGRFGVPASYVGPLTHLAALEDLIRNEEFAHFLLRPEGLRTDFSTIVDIASLTGSFPAILEGAGVRYLVHANNQDRGPFRVLGGLHRLSPYYWEGTNGGRVLVWLSRMYCELRKVCGSPTVPSAAKRGLDLWLDEYESATYAPDTVLMYGQEADNTDLDPQPAAFLDRWNTTYSYPRLVPSNVSDFFRDVETRFGPTHPTIKGDGGAYWEDGAGSSLATTARLRHAQANLPAAETLESLAVLHTPAWSYPAAAFDEAWRQLLLADEHTWGAFLSGPDPDALLAHDQWATKQQMIDGAAHWANRLLHVAATRHSLNWNTDGREVVVYNPHTWPVSGSTTAEIGRTERLCDPITGTEIPTRRLRTTTTQTVIEFWVDDLPGLSYRRFILRPPTQEYEQTIEETAGSAVLENPFYRLVIDTHRGVVTSWFDKTLQRELIDDTDTWGFGQLVYARGGEGTRLMSNRADLPEGNPELLGGFDLITARIERWDGGTSLRLEGNVAYGRLIVEWTLPSDARRFDVRYTYHKAERLEKEAAYVAFPLALPAARVESDAQLGWVNWDQDELPGGCKEWLPLQTGILVSGTGASVLICSPDIPLFCVGDVVRGRWPKELDLTGGRIFSYVLNNYWHTNYPASQGGPLTFAYSLTSAATIPHDEAYRLGRQTRRPLYTHRISFQDFRQPRAPYLAPAGETLAKLAPTQVVLSTLKRARWTDSWIARLQEIAGQDQIASLTIPGRPITQAWLTDLLEEDLHPLSVEPDGTLHIPIPAWGLTTVRFTEY
jgi:alpha-mannosidase